MSNQSIVLRAFNQHLKDFIDDIQKLSPNSLKVRALKNSVLTFLKINPKKVIELWYYKVHNKYSSQILNEDLDFFLDKDYSDDVKDAEGNGISLSMDLIDELREPIKEMDDENRKMAIKYVKEMTQLSALYYA